MGLKDSESAPLESWTSTTIHIRNSEIEECKKKKKKKRRVIFFFQNEKKKKIKEKKMGTCTLYCDIQKYQKKSNFDIQKYQK